MTALIHKYLKLVLYLSLPIVFLISCGVDLGLRDKKIKGVYHINEFGDIAPYHYYIIEKGKDELGGIFEGRVQNIGRIENKLIVDVRKFSNSDVSGWYELNLETGKVSGPITNHKIVGSYKPISARTFFNDL